MSKSMLSFRYIFGISAQVCENGAFLDDSSVAYVAGQSIVLYNMRDKRQRFIHAAEITESITSFAFGSGRRLAAIAERGEKPVAHIFDLKTFRRKKSVTAVETASKEFVSMQFSSDDQTLLTLTGAPDWTLLCWMWSKSKLIAFAHCSISSPLYRCTFNPIDSTVACVTGKDQIKFFRMADKEMRPLHEHYFTDQLVTCQCWMRHPDDHLLVGTDSGLVHLFRSGEHIYPIPCSPGPDYPIYSMCSIPGGFVAGSKEGVFIMFTYDESRDQVFYEAQFSMVKILTHDLCYGNIVSLFVDPLDEWIGAVSSDNQLMKLPTQFPAKLTSEDVCYVEGQFHGPKPITGMDVCVKRPLVITCCRDNTVKLWNFQTHEIEFQKSYAEEMFSVALHPSGLHCAIGFTDKLRVYHILVDDARVCLEVPIKGCRECRFSKGGHFLAASHGNSIIVYDFNTGEKIADLRGHNSKVRCIQWMDSGCQLVSCGQDGAVYLWDIDGAKRSGEFVLKGPMYTSVAISGDSVYVVGSDKAIRQLALPDLSSHRSVETGALLTNIALAITKTTLFAGTGDFGKPGYIRGYNYPVTGDFDEYACSAMQVTRMRLTPDESFLIAADDCGCLVVYEIRDKQDTFQRNNPTIVPDLLTLDSWKDEILVTRGELEDRASTIAELRTKVDELKLHNEYQLKLKEMNYAEKIKEATDKFQQELEQAKTKLELLKEERYDSEMESLENIKQLEEKHQFDVQETETNFQAQIMELVESYQQLTRDRDAQIERLEDQRRMLVATHERYVHDLSLDYGKRLEEERQSRIQLEEERFEIERETTEVQTQVEDDLDTEIENLRRAFEEKLTACREMTLKYKGENGIMKKKYVVMQRDIEDQKDEMKVLYERELDLHEQIKMLEKEVSAHKKEIKIRDLSIGDKEKKIYELKKKNQELDKFKFVLDYKIRELKMQIEPRQLEIMAMRDKIKEMDGELERYHKTNASLDAMIGALRQRIEELQVETKSQRMNAKKLENKVSHFRSDVQATVAHILTPASLKAATKRLLENHGSSGTIKPRIDPDVEGEYGRHKDFLVKSLQELKLTLENNIVENTSSNSALMQQNMELIQQINRQRDFNKSTRNSVQAEIGRIRRHMQILAANPSTNNNNNNNDGTGFDAYNAASAVNVTTPRDRDGAMTAGDGDLDPVRILERNRQRIVALRAAVNELERRSMNMMSKAFSREVLPPMDGVHVTDSIATYEPSLAAGDGEQFVGESLTLPPIVGSNNNNAEDM